ncbi:hypothetical protein F751_4052 [Auxenochlorella protothecoides]|uniref:Uncharacterized protein n=1 Tax=Auxenochlorella protothecoides TaxID=3075 RepID=A0A087ST34_AUXPR|nr:hypothetical protein F751_4052 [Auxenochlorella protothecoides]KFM28888.1 hypothetical protein F751_4052 [Auxenochlorella protothecoides]
MMLSMSLTIRDTTNHAGCQKTSERGTQNRARAREYVSVGVLPLSMLPECLI